MPKSPSLCHPEKSNKAFGLCSSCYQRDRKALELKKEMRTPNCHPERPYHSKGYCKSCYERQRLIDNPDKKNKKYEKVKSWHENNPGRWKTLAEKRKNDPNLKMRDKISKIKHKLRSYSITYEEYQNFLKLNGEFCAICLKKLTSKNRHLDHDHISMKIRGFLCNGCNRGLGYLKDSIEGLEKALQYLKNPIGDVLYERRKR